METPGPYQVANTERFDRKAVGRATSGWCDTAGTATNNLGLAEHLLR